MLKILSIDDEPLITKLIGYQLAIHDIQVVTANAAREGIELVRSEAPDLVLLDMMMPDMGGLDVFREIRAFSSVPILAFSALSDQQQIERALKAGFNGYIEKPCPGDDLAGKILEFFQAK
jgi:DNA-binding response OmpR family regulator